MSFVWSNKSDQCSEVCLQPLLIHHLRITFKKRCVKFCDIFLFLTKFYPPSLNLKAASGPPWKANIRMSVPSGPLSRLVPHHSPSRPPLQRRCWASRSVAAEVISSATSAMLTGAKPTSKHISSPCPPPTMTKAPAGCQVGSDGVKGQEARSETPRCWSCRTREESLSPRRSVASWGWREQETGWDGSGIRVTDRRRRRSRALSYTQVSAQDPSLEPWGPTGSSTVRSWYGWSRLKRQSRGVPSVRTDLRTFQREEMQKKRVIQRLILENPHYKSCDNNAERTCCV